MESGWGGLLSIIASLLQLIITIVTDEPVAMATGEETTTTSFCT